VGSRLVLGLLRCHQAQVGGGADLSRPDKTNFLERRQVFFDRHEMGRPMTERRRRIDVSLYFRGQF